MHLLHPPVGYTSVKFLQTSIVRIMHIRFKMKMFSRSGRSTCLIVWMHPKLNLKTRVPGFACVLSVYVCSSLHVCWYVCRWSLWTSSLGSLAGSERQQLLVVKLLLVALPECTGKGEDRESLCHLAMARDVRRSLGMSIIALTEDELLPALSAT